MRRETPIGNLAALCVNLLSSSLCSGASSSLLREVVKLAWVGGLRLTAVLSEKASIDPEVVGILLNSIGLSTGEAIDDDEPEDGEDGESGSDSESEENSGDEGVFAKAANNPDALGNDDSADDMDTSQSAENTAVEDEEIELDSERLQAFLEEDNDAEVEEADLRPVRETLRTEI